MTDINSEEASKFLELLFSNHFKQYKGFIQILHRRVNQRIADKPIYFDSISGLLNKFDMFTGDVYYGVAPREFERGTKEAVKYITCIWTDIDINRHPGDFDTQENALKVVNAFELKPSVIVNSGSGLHLYWLLKESCNELDTAEEILKGLIKELKGDKGQWYINKLLRVPGTINYGHSTPLECKIISLNNNLRYDLKDFEKYRVMGLKEFENKEAIFNKDVLPLFSIEDLFTNRIAPEILNLISSRDTKGKYLKGDGTIDRNKRDQAVILELVKTGHKPEAIRGIFRNKDYLISDKYFEMGKRGDYYLALSIENAQKFLDSGIIQEKQNKKLMVPKEADEILRTALTPSLPILIEQDGQQLFSFTYENPLTNTFVRGDTNKEILKELNLTEDDLRYRTIQYEGTIANYLMDIKARTGVNKIEGSIKDIAKFLFNKPRQEDYKRVEVNLKSLAIRQYLIKKDRQEVVFMVINPFKFNENTKTFTAGLSELVPKIVGEVLRNKKETFYINKTKKEYYPKQDRYIYNIRNYFASKKHSQTIKQISGIKLLENSGYLADVSLNRKKYRNSEAQKIIDKFTKIGLKEYGFVVGCHKQDLMIKDIRKKMFYIRISDKRRDLIRHDNEFLDILGKFILRQPGNNNLAISINRAQGLFNKYGVIVVKEAYFNNIKKEGFSITELQRILAQGAQEQG